MYYCQDVKNFHDKFGLETPAEFRLLPPDLYTFRLNFLKEELEEFVDACAQRDLATAIDSLIDLVYVTCGAALLYGITPQRFSGVVDRCATGTGLFDLRGQLGEEAKPHLLSDEHQRTFVEILKVSVDLYEIAHRKEDQSSIEEALVTLYVDTLAVASLMGFTVDHWNVLWNEVQRANMEKERVLRAEDSKRGSTWDVRKPPGWRPPQIEQLLETILNDYQEESNEQT